MWDDEWSEPAAKYFRSLDQNMQRRIMEAVQALRENPLGETRITPCKGHLKGAFSRRVGSYRLIFVRDADHRVITIEAIGDRKNVYHKPR